MESGISRRQLLGASAAAMGLALGRTRAPTVSRRSSGFVANNLVVMTVTPTTAEIFWLTVSPSSATESGSPEGAPTNTELWLAPADSREPLALVYSDDTPTMTHRAVVTGLEPGREYRFEARSDGVRAVPTLLVTQAPGAPERQGRFRTLDMPQGTYLRSVAILNDSHLGQSRQGIIVGELIPYAVQAPGKSPHTEISLQDALADLDERFGHPPIYMNGDVTDIGIAAQCARTKEIFKTYGEQNKHWWLTRGNHDRAVPAGKSHYDDFFGDLFDLPWQRLWTHEDGGLRVIGLDTTRFQASGGVINDSQFSELAAEFRRDPDMPTIVLGHHPVTFDASATTPSGRFFTMGPQSAHRLQRMEKDAEGVFLHFAGHTHRARRDHGDYGGHVNYLETPALSADPGGFTMVHLFSDGYIVNFHRLHTPDSLAWLARSRFAAFGLMSQQTHGSLSARNHVVRHDLSGITPSGAPLPSTIA